MRSTLLLSAAAICFAGIAFAGDGKKSCDYSKCADKASKTALVADASGKASGCCKNKKCSEVAVAMVNVERDGQTMTAMLLSRAKAEKSEKSDKACAEPCVKAPAIVLSGFGGHSHEGVKMYAKELAKAGYVVLAMNDRVSKGCDGSETTNVASADDLKAGVAYLAAHKQVDADRIAVVGVGSGSAAAVRLASMDERVRAVAAVAGSYDCAKSCSDKSDKVAKGCSDKSDTALARRVLLVHGEGSMTKSGAGCGAGWDTAKATPAMVKAMTSEPKFEVVSDACDKSLCTDEKAISAATSRMLAFLEQSLAPKAEGETKQTSMAN